MRFSLQIICLFTLFLISSSLLFAEQRFYYEGGGEIKLKNLKNSQSIQIRFKDEAGHYIPQNILKINRVYGIGPKEKESISLRFLELLSYLQNHFKGEIIEIISGFRSSSFNSSLRKQGKMAAQSSMHIEAAAADLKIQNIQILELKKFLLNLNCCGVGYYGSQHVHVDVGPKRWWDEKTSGTEKKEAQENEKIIAYTKYDYYLKNEEIEFDFSRITQYPIQVSNNLHLEMAQGLEWKEKENLSLNSKEDLKTCIEIKNKDQAKNIRLKTAFLNKKAQYRIKINFCEMQKSKIPEFIYTNIFELK